jgi:predicted Zn-ribbon and HTH transcriptional regulator
MADYIASLYTFITSLPEVLSLVAVSCEGLRCGMSMEAEMSTPSHCRRSQSQLIVSSSFLIHVRARVKGEVGHRHRVFQ